MTSALLVRYLLDTNVFREIQKGPAGHKNVRAWLDGVDDDAVWLSVMMVQEINRGIAKLAQKKPEEAAAIRARFDEVVADYGDRVADIDGEVAAEWGRLQGEKDKHQDDLAFVATARVRDMVLVTRNVRDVQGRGVRVLDPFVSRPVIREV